MRVPIRSFREAVPLYVLVLVYIPECDQQYRAPRTSSIHGSSSANIRNMIVSRDSARARILIMVVINSTEPRTQAVSTAAAVQTSEMFVVLAVFESLYSLRVCLNFIRPSWNGGNGTIFCGIFNKKMMLIGYQNRIDSKRSHPG